MKPIQNLIVFFVFAGVVLTLPSCGGGGGGGGGGGDGSVPTIYVDGSVAASGDGTSWSEGFKTIQEGLDAAGDYDLVLVANGTYTGTGNKDLNFNGKAIHLRSDGGAENCVIDCENSGRGFYFGSGEDANSVVEGFTIRNGAAVDGSAVYCGDSSSPTITNCTLSENSADYGGAIFCDGSSPSIINCAITDNIAAGEVGDSCGGGICCYNLSNPAISNCAITNNTVTAVGGGAHGGGIFCDNSSPRITECTIMDNLASGAPEAEATGGGIHCYNGSNPTITKCIIRSNTASYFGGGICCWENSSPAIKNCIIANNETTETNCGGGGLCCYTSSSPEVNNCTIANNIANYGGGILLDNSAPTLNNTILWGNSATAGGHQAHAFTSSDLTLHYCDYSNQAGDYTGNPGPLTLQPDSYCITDDPVFEAPGNDYHLQEASPCIDAGDNSLVPAGITTDLDGNPRIVDGDGDETDIVDIGAYEFQPADQ